MHTAVLKEPTPCTVTLKGVRQSFPLGAGQHLQVLDIAQLTLAPGSITLLRGPSGTGKTTLLNLMAGIAVPDTGHIYIGGTDIVALSEPQRDRFRAAHIGYILQTFNLLAAFTALDNVLLAMLFTNIVPKPARRQRAITLLSRLGLSARLKHRPAQLSRGEQQRVAIARALANQPPLLLADEPCASLDVTTTHLVLDMLLTICREERTTVLMVIHDSTLLGGVDQQLDMAQINHVIRRSSGASA